MSTLPTSQTPTGNRARTRRLRLDDARAVLRLTHELRDLAADPARQQRHLVDSLADLLNAQDGLACQFRRFRRDQPGAYMHVVYPTEGSPDYRRYMAELLPLVTSVGGERHDPFIDNTIDSDARHTLATLWDLVGDWRGLAGGYPAVAETMHAAGLVDGMVSFVRDPVHRDDLCLGLALHRFRDGMTANRRYTARERTLLRFATEETLRLLGRGVLHARPAAAVPDEPAADRPLPPRLAEVRGYVLAGHTPKRMARQMGISIHTLREHFQRLYRVYGVTGREELTARVTEGLSRSGTPRTTPDRTEPRTQ